MKFSKEKVAIGDSFTKVGSGSNAVYVVAAFFDAPGLPQHIRLVADGYQMLMSTAAVLDPRFWKRVPAAKRD
jgi:hypothetical protein